MFVAGRRRGVGIGLLAAFMVVASACGGSGSAPRSLPRLSTTPAAESSTTPPTSGAAELAAASDVVRAYFHAKNQLARNMNTRDLAKLMTPECSCREVVRSAQALAQQHRRYFGVAHLRAVTPAIDSRTLVEVLVSYDASSGGTVDSAGHVIYRGPSHRGVTQMFYVRAINGSWFIDQIRLISAGSIPR